MPNGLRYSLYSVTRIFNKLFPADFIQLIELTCEGRLLFIELILISDHWSAVPYRTWECSENTIVI